MTVGTNILLTGASGFLGSRLLDALDAHLEYNNTAAFRMISIQSSCNSVQISTIDGNTDWSEALTNQQVVIHAAARAHIMKDEAIDPLEEYRKVNVDGTLNLARQAAAAGINRFIFISSIKVNGEQTHNGQTFKPDDIPAPEDAYGISKWEAEQGLQIIAAETGMEIVIIRPPLVYGPGVKGNFASMINIIQRGLPLPLGAIHNQRSLVALDNLVNLIITCIKHPAAANQVFLAGDGQDLSTTKLLCGVARAMGKPSRLISVPAWLLMLGMTLIGKRVLAQRLLGSLQVDITKAQTVLGWQPPVSVEDGLKRCLK